MSISPSKVHTFQQELYEWYQSNRRSFPWRIPTLRLRRDGSVDPYKILVSEVMLQQTQASRVVEKYKDFLIRFPTVTSLAEAPLAEVLRSWQGLGYNRRGKALHDAAKQIVSDFHGNVPKEKMQLEALPGIGPYTASAVRVFAFNVPDVVIETNVRTVHFHHFLQTRNEITDSELYDLVAQTMDVQNPREWYTALMDYGAYLKASGVKTNAQSKHYTRQSKFEGSDRQVRGALLRALSDTPQTEKMLCKKIARQPEKIHQQLSALKEDGMVIKEGRLWRLAE